MNPSLQGDTASPIPSISAKQLAASLVRVDAPLVIDVRKSAAFDAAQMIPGALRRLPALALGEPHAWLEALPRDRALVMACVHGHEVSKNACKAALKAGFHATYLENGITGWFSGNAPKKTHSADVLQYLNQDSPTRWVTRERPKIDRIACPWLIRRFIDPLAQFFYVPSHEVIAQATALAATPYDVPGVTFTHRNRTEEERCSFDAFIEDFGLDDPALLKLADIVRGSDTGNLALTPQSAGLTAVSLGLSRLYPNDHAMLEHGMVMYDALYAWLQGATGEVHNAALFK
jgi:rhodanese-related sulfurtransferase